MAEFPHCNSTTIHEPGTCYYCDRFPGLQAARAKSGEPFTSAEANGWSGNVAVREGDLHSHMGAQYVVGGDDLVEGDVRFQDGIWQRWDRGEWVGVAESALGLFDYSKPQPQAFDEALRRLAEDMACTINFKRGWRCVRVFHAAGPCALVPSWWNLVSRWRYR